ncbi:MAG TPA: trypsin-like peptidase domain-containing protein [Nakamurella sp.]
MSQDMPPRAGDQPAGSRDAAVGNTASNPRFASASPVPSPADTPTGSSSSMPGAGGFRATSQPHAWSQVPPGPANPSGSTPSATQPGRPGPTGEQSWWQPRPSGAWASQSWGGPATSQGPTAAAANTGRYTQTLPRSGPGADYPSHGGSGHGATPGTSTDPASAPRPRGRKTSLVVATTTALALIAGFAGGYAGSAWESNNAATDSSLSRLNTSAAVSQNLTPAPTGSVQEVAAKVLPSVVSVLASSGQSAGEGSGVVLTDDGLILTNNHVVDGATDLEVRFNDGTTATATVVGKTATDDLAVIKADGVSGLTAASLGSSADLQVGQQVVAIGSPLGLSATVTTGIVSALNRPVRTSSEDQPSRSQSQDTVINAVQTDAAINPGNSGGALVDMNGNVIGINSAIASLSDSSSGQSGSIGVGFAIPIDQAKRIAQEIIDNGQATHAVLGAAVGDATDGNSQIPTGAMIDSITQGSGAEAAGLEKGDVVTAIGDVKVESADALIAAVRAQTPNGTTTITFDRNGAPQTVNVTLGSATAN